METVTERDGWTAKDYMADAGVEYFPLPGDNPAPGTAACSTFGCVKREHKWNVLHEAAAVNPQPDASNNPAPGTAESGEAAEADEPAPGAGSGDVDLRWEKGHISA